MGVGLEDNAWSAADQRSAARETARGLAPAAASLAGACALWAVVRLIAQASFSTHAQWIDLAGTLALLLACCLPEVCRFLGLRWLLGALLLLGILTLQRSEVDQQALHHFGCTEHVRVLSVQKSQDGMSGGEIDFYTVSVLDGPPLAPVRGGIFTDWHWRVGGTYAVTVDPRGLATVGRGSNPGAPVVQRALQVPLGFGLACALWQPAHRLRYRRRSAALCASKGGSADEG
ncbi:hypothetical protein [Streptacidiphilus carbonis]|jgi:hypothetical protein|uniref:hypothetical protein n=1 Tax=Streptacidiphilus carbonis TaxID=105422 RepID=UPI00126A4559|nr:hypothetical protein [Streptacidiphilus carbonis]